MYKLQPEEIKQDDTIPEVEEIPEEEEGGKYIGDQKMDRLASMLGVDKSAKGAIEFEGKEINLFRNCFMLVVRNLIHQKKLLSI
jgi:hypothetical protein